MSTAANYQAVHKESVQRIQVKLQSYFTSIAEIEKKWDEWNMKAMDPATMLVNNTIRKQFIKGNSWGAFTNDKVLKEKVILKMEEECLTLLHKMNEIHKELVLSSFIPLFYL